ncbi:MAG: FadR family transcriptional regulator [Desulfobacterales bacterium]|nr:FadR family transcriptional regulator [Desulfobacterales bacterium]MCP4163179.1 FadR family transcriptional regulator [Deltaproteobacteria bacterium]
MTNNISETVFQKLQKDIFDGHYAIGSRLPSERELSEKFKASRNTIRDALGRLDHLKLVQKIPQSGSYVTDYKKEASLPLLIHYINNSLGLSVDALSSFMDFRLVCEVFAVKKAVHQIRDEDICFLYSILDDKLKNLKKPDFLSEADFKFHEYIFQMADSLAIQLFFNTLKPVFITYLNLLYKLKDADSKSIIDIQRNLVAALEKRDVELSGFIMEKLILFGINRIKEAKLQFDENTVNSE